MTLLLHCGAEEVNFDELRDVPTPTATASHVPIPHFRLVDMVRHTLAYYGHTVVEEHHGITQDGARYFGVMMLKSDYGGYQDTVGLRNSHDKSFPIGIGSHVFTCDNLAFVADHVIRRKHTANAKRALPGLVQDVVEPLADQRLAQQRTFERYRGQELTEVQADHALMTAWRRGIVNITAIPEVVREWQEPSFDEFREGGMTIWRLFNAVTYILNGKVVANPGVTQQLHQIIDQIAA